jgi:hypothetical protein
LQDLEDEFLLAKAGRVLDAHVFRNVVEVDNALVFEFDKIKGRAAGFSLLLFTALLTGMTVMVAAVRLLRALLAALLGRAVLDDCAICARVSGLRRYGRTVLSRFSDGSGSVCFRFGRELAFLLSACLPGTFLARLISLAIALASFTVPRAFRLAVASFGIAVRRARAAMSVRALAAFG